MEASLIELLVETAFSMVLWESFFVGIIRPKIYDWGKRQPFWQDIQKRRGNLAASGHHDFVMMSVLAIHHLIGGFLMLYGSYSRNSTIWKHGVLLEVGTEICDLIANARGTWPYERGMIPTPLRFGVLFHHLPGICLIIPLVLNSYHENEHVQTIGAWLLFAGALTVSVGAFVYTRNFSNPFEMKQAALAQLFSFALFFYARWVVYPAALLTFLNELEANQHSSETLIKGVKIGGVFMGIFNSILLLVSTPKTIRYVGKAFFSDKVTLDEVVVLKAE